MLTKRKRVFAYCIPLMPIIMEVCVRRRTKMKKQYVLAMLLLLSFGVVSTMAFSSTTRTATLGIWDIAAGTGTVGITADSQSIKAYGLGTIQFTWTWSVSSPPTDAIAYITIPGGSGNIDFQDGTLTFLSVTSGGLSGDLFGTVAVDDSIIELSMNQITDGEACTIKIQGPGIVSDVTGIFMTIEEITVGSDAVLLKKEAEY